MLIQSLDMVYDELKKNDVQIYTTYSYSHKIKTNNKSKQMNLGRIWINLIFPDDFPLINEELNDSKLKKKIEYLYKNYDSEIIASTLNNLNKESFNLASIIPVTFDINSLKLPANIEEKRNKLLNSDLSPDEFNDRLQLIVTDWMEYLKKNDSGMYAIVKSGSKGDSQLLGNLMIGRGSMIDIEGEISKPVTHSHNDGFDLKEYYTASAQARFTQYVKAIASSEPGYLSRQIIFASSNILLDNDDCKTRKLLKLTVTENIFKRIIGRYYVDENKKLEEITTDSNLVGKNIELRSPIYCKSTIGICKICYGKLAELLNTKHIGIVSGNVMNDVGVNGAMTLRHNTSFVNFEKTNFKKHVS